MILMPGCNCCGSPTGGCPAESITVTLTDLPNENRVDTSGANPTDYDGDNYMTSNEGDFTLAKTADYVETGRFEDFHVCIYGYEDDLSLGGPALKIQVVLHNHYEAATPYWRVRVEVEADGGRLSWEDDTTASSPLSTTLTNSDVVENSSAEYVLYYYYNVPVPWTLQPTMSVTVQAVTVGSLGQCETPLCTSWFPATPGTCNQIMGVTNATDRPAYCGTNPTIYSVAPDSSAPNNTLTFVNAGTDTLDLTLQDWTANHGSYGTRTISFGGLTHSLGWGGIDCVDLLERYPSGVNTGACGGGSGYLQGTRHGWVGAFNVVLTDDYSPSGGSVTNYNCTALASVNLARRYNSSYAATAVAASRRIEFIIALYYYAGVEPTGNWLTQVLNTHVSLTSDGTLGEDAYVYGSFPTYTHSDVFNEALLCGLSTGSVNWTSRQFTLAQG